MGLDINAAQFLIAARKRGVRFDRTIMLGRQSLNVFPRTMVDLLRRNGLNPEKFKVAGLDCAYAEPLFEALGARQTDAMDNSNFEGAQFVHDLNQPIPTDWKEKFDVVFDGGTLEHVFNFPVALRNAMELLRENGRLFIETPVNNLCGHGFYQFSPELFYRTLSEENGFQVERMVIHRVGPYGRWYEVSDPNAIRERVELITFTPMHLLVQARRIRCQSVFAQMPQQSDYTVLWQKAASATPQAIRKPRFARIARLINAVKYGIEFYHRQSLGNRRFFRKTDRED